RGNLLHRPGLDILHAELQPRHDHPDGSRGCQRHDQRLRVDDGFEGLNVTTIAIEIPTSLLPDTVGMYASTSRQRNRQYRKDGDQKASGDYARVPRLGNPLVNEVIIGTGRKDFWNSQDPDDESQFLGFYLTSRLAIAI